MLNCKQATRLVSESLECKLTLQQQLKLKLHLFICHLCRDYARHLRLLHRIAPALEARIEEQHEHTLAEAAKARIRRELERK